MSAISVHQAGLSDLSALEVLFDHYRQFQGQPSDPPAAREFLRERLDRSESVLFIAQDGALAVGFAQLYPSFSSVSLSRVFILNDLFVVGTARRKGVAALLLRAVESCAWSRGCTRVALNVARDNTSAQALYTAQGWKRDEQYFMFHRFPPPA